MLFYVEMVEPGRQQPEKMRVNRKLVTNVIRDRTQDRATHERPGRSKVRKAGTDL